MYTSNPAAARRQRRLRRIRHAAHSAAAWLADAILADPELPADLVARQLAMLRFFGALAAEGRLRVVRPE